MVQSSLSDHDLIVKARSGSDAGFAALVDRHQQAVRNFLRKIVPNSHEADDLAQETFLAAWSSLSKLEDGAKFQTWVMGIAWRKAKMTARSAVRTRERDHAWSETQDGSQKGVNELALALKQALEQLSPDQRAAVALCLGEGWSHGDAAKALEIPLGTLKSHVNRGRAKLMEILEDAR